jgi:hypothetical protein
LTLLTSPKIFNKCYLQMILKKRDQSYIVGMLTGGRKWPPLSVVWRFRLRFGTFNWIKSNHGGFFGYPTMNIDYLLALYDNTLLNYLKVKCHCQRWLILRCMLNIGNLTIFWFIFDWLFHLRYDRHDVGPNVCEKRNLSSPMLNVDTQNYIHLRINSANLYDITAPT